jgi:hypothetical protein
MDPEKKLGIIYIIIAFCVPLLTMPFLSGYSREKSIAANLYGVSIELRKDAHSRPDRLGGLEEPHQGKFALSRLTPKRIPFRFFLVVTLIFLYMGIVRIDKARRREHERTHGFNGQ